MSPGALPAETAAAPSVATGGTSRVLEVLAVGTRLGLTSFGGPVAHLGYFRDEMEGERLAHAHGLREKGGTDR